MFKHIWLKELKGELYTWKGMVWLLVASILFSFTSYLLLTNKELSLLDQTELLWLLGKVIIGVGLLVVAIDSSSIITSEFEKETAESIFLTPLKMRDFLLGKLLAVFSLWFFIFLIAIPYIVVTSAGSHLALAFIGYVLLLGSLGALGVVLVAFAVSLLYRSSKNTLTTTLIMFLVFAIPALFASNMKIAGIAQTFSAVNPIDNIFSSLDNVLVDYQLSPLQNLKFIAPLAGFGAAAFLFVLFAVKKFQKQGVIRNE